MISHRWLIGCAVLGVVLLGASPSEAQPTLDQSFTAPANLSANINECCRYIAQTFTAGLSGTLAGIAIDIQSTSAFPLHVAIRDVTGNVPGKAILGETTLSTSSTSLSQMISFPQTIAIVAGQRYAIVVDYPDAPPPGAGQGEGVWIGATGDPYAGGEQSESRPNETAWQRQTCCDVHFQTFVSL